ncbi:hypothetical protein ACIBAI_28320 [Streptomyces sp. NPDC051041]|uniref:hypothetical protein n=1 Tax=Streptomyces sp. NPDC051041 TaxID=3365640 RepID=UPI003794076A
MLKRFAAVGAAALSLAVALPASPAHALDRVSCRSVKSVMIINYGDREHPCFASAGTQQVAI